MSRPVPFGIAAVTADDAGILARLLDQGFAKHPGEGRSFRHALDLNATGDVKRPDAMITIIRLFGWRISLPFFRHHMNQQRPGGAVSRMLQSRDELVQVMPIDRADILEPHVLEQRSDPCRLSRT